MNIEHPIPRLPVLDWNALSGTWLSPTPCILANQKTQFTHSGRASILLALEMIGVGPGDKVLAPTYHCPTMIAPIIARGAEVIFYPLDCHGSPRLDWIEKNEHQCIRAILVTHFFGLPQPLAAVRQWCDQHGVLIIEDCAHALFGVSGDRELGSWGDLAIASLTKFLPVPEGGCLINNKFPGLMPMLDSPGPLRQIKSGFDIIHAGVNHGRLKGLGALVRGFIKCYSIIKKDISTDNFSSSPSLADGFSIDNAQSHRALTLASRWTARYIPRERIVVRRRENYIFLSKSLSGLSHFRPLISNLPDHCAPYVFPLWVDHPDPGYLELRRLDFPVSRWDRLWPSTPNIEEDAGIKWSDHVLQLACHQDITADELKKMVETLKQIYEPRVIEFATQRARETEPEELRNIVRTEQLGALITHNKII